MPLRGCAQLHHTRKGQSRNLCNAPIQAAAVDHERLPVVLGYVLGTNLMDGAY